MTATGADPADPAAVRVDGARLWDSVEQLAAVGATPQGGVERIALTDADRAGRELVSGWLRELGCELRLDPIGNLFARRPGTDPERAPVLLGSHLDSQPNGGRHDGALGVLAGVELLRTLDDHGVRTQAPIELVVWTDEEGARFDVSCIGSSVWAGQLALEDACALRDRDGVTVGEALDELGWRGPAAPVAAPAPAGYFELHIEQGPVLESLGVPVGIVTAIPGIRWLEVVLEGVERHAGSTPMEGRRDALLATARLTQRIDEIARARPPYGRGTVCTIAAEPNAGSVIVGRTRILVDLRHVGADTLDAMQDELAAAATALAAEGIETAVNELWVQPPVTFDAECVELVRRAASTIGAPAHELVSGAGHDAGYVAMVAPTAMVFVPCRDGLSHNPAEHVEPEHATIGTDVLLHAVIARAGVGAGVGVAS